MEGFEAGEVVGFVAEDVGAFPAFVGEVFFGEGGDGALGFVFVLVEEEDSVGARVVLELVGRLSVDGGGENGGAPVFFDVVSDEFGAAEVGDVGAHAGVVHGVGEVAHEGDVDTVEDVGADGEGATEYAHVGVDAHDDEVFASFFLENGVDRFAVVGDVVVVIDVEGFDLASPYAFVNHVFGHGGVAAAVGVVDGEGRFAVGVEVFPAVGVGHVDEVDGFGAFASGGAVVKAGDAAGRVDDEDAFVACGAEELIHAWCHLGDACGGGGAPVAVPHIANDDGGFLWLPLDELLVDAPLALDFDAGLHGEFEGLRGGGCGEDEGAGDVFEFVHSGCMMAKGRWGFPPEFRMRYMTQRMVFDR